MRVKRRPKSQNGIRRPAVKRAALNDLQHLPLVKLQQWAAAATNEVERLRAHLKQTQLALDDVKQLQQLLVRLEVQRTPHPSGDRSLGSHAEVAAHVLAAVGHPMQLKDLLAAMASRGAVVAGKTERQRRSNLIITLSRSALVRRVGHGVYALTESRASA